MGERLVAWLRAINVGGHTVKMERLRELVSELGLNDVKTYIASGNVLFDDPGGERSALEARIAAALEQGLGYAVETFVRTGAELAAVLAQRPFGNEDTAGTTLFIGFLSAQPSDAALAKLEALETEIDALRVCGRELYWLRRDHRGSSALAGAKLERALGMAMTMRNVTTVRKVAALLGAVSE